MKVKNSYPPAGKHKTLTHAANKFLEVLKNRNLNIEVIYGLITVGSKTRGFITIKLTTSKNLLTCSVTGNGLTQELAFKSKETSKQDLAKKIVDIFSDNKEFRLTCN